MVAHFVLSFIPPAFPAGRPGCPNFLLPPLFTMQFSPKLQFIDMAEVQAAMLRQEKLAAKDGLQGIRPQPPAHTPAATLASSASSARPTTAPAKPGRRLGLPATTVTTWKRTLQVPAPPAAKKGSMSAAATPAGSAVSTWTALTRTRQQLIRAVNAADAAAGLPSPPIPEQRAATHGVGGLVFQDWLRARERLGNTAGLQPNASVSTIDSACADESRAARAVGPQLSSSARVMVSMENAAANKLRPRGTVGLATFRAMQRVNRVQQSQVVRQRHMQRLAATQPVSPRSAEMQAQQRAFDELTARRGDVALALPTAGELPPYLTRRRQELTATGLASQGSTFLTSLDALSVCSDDMEGLALEAAARPTCGPVPPPPPRRPSPPPPVYKVGEMHAAASFSSHMLDMMNHEAPPGRQHGSPLKTFRAMQAAASAEKWASREALARDHREHADAKKSRRVRLHDAVKEASALTRVHRVQSLARSAGWATLLLAVQGSKRWLQHTAWTVRSKRHALQVNLAASKIQRAWRSVLMRRRQMELIKNAVNRNEWAANMLVHFLCASRGLSSGMINLMRRFRMRIIKAQRLWRSWSACQRARAALLEAAYDAEMAELWMHALAVSAAQEDESQAAAGADQDDPLKVMASPGRSLRLMRIAASTTQEHRRAWAKEALGRRGAGWLKKQQVLSNVRYAGSRHSRIWRALETGVPVVAPCADEMVALPDEHSPEQDSDSACSDGLGSPMGSQAADAGNLGVTMRVSNRALVNHYLQPHLEEHSAGAVVPGSKMKRDRAAAKARSRAATAPGGAKRSSAASSAKPAPPETAGSARINRAHQESMQRRGKAGPGSAEHQLRVAKETREWLKQYNSALQAGASPQVKPKRTKRRLFDFLPSSIGQAIMEAGEGSAQEVGNAVSEEQLDALDAEAGPGRQALRGLQLALLPLATINAANSAVQSTGAWGAAGKAELSPSDARGGGAGSTAAGTAATAAPALPPLCDTLLSVAFPDRHARLRNVHAMAGSQSPADLAGIVAQAMRQAKLDHLQLPPSPVSPGARAMPTPREVRAERGAAFIAQLRAAKTAQDWARRTQQRHQRGFQHANEARSCLRLTAPQQAVLEALPPTRRPVLPDRASAQRCVRSVLRDVRLMFREEVLLPWARGEAVAAADVLAAAGSGGSGNGLSGRDMVGTGPAVSTAAGPDMLRTTDLHTSKHVALMEPVSPSAQYAATASAMVAPAEQVQQSADPLGAAFGAMRSAMMNTAPAHAAIKWDDDGDDDMLDGSEAQRQPERRSMAEAMTPAAKKRGLDKARRLLQQNEAEVKSSLEAQMLQDAVARQRAPPPYMCALAFMRGLAARASVADLAIEARTGPQLGMLAAIMEGDPNSALLMKRDCPDTATFLAARKLVRPYVRDAFLAAQAAWRGTAARRRANIASRNASPPLQPGPSAPRAPLSRRPQSQGAGAGSRLSSGLSRR